MKSIKLLNFFFASVLLTGITTNSASAQPTLAQCVSELRQSSVLPYDALSNCSDSVKNQTLGSCIGDLRKFVTPYDAASACQKALQNATRSQSLGQCVSEVKRHLTSYDAASACQNLFKSQDQNK